MKSFKEKIAKQLVDKGYIKQANIDDENLSKMTNEIVETISKILDIKTLPEDENINGYNDKGQELFNAILKIIKNYND